MSRRITPFEITKRLDRDVIGQETAKQMLATSIVDHYIQVQAGQTSNKPHVLLIGNTGCGKSYMVRKLSEIVGVPFVSADATKFTSAGYSGLDVQQVLIDLIVAAKGNKEAAEKGIVHVDEIDKVQTKKLEDRRDISGQDVQRGLLKFMETGSVCLSDSHTMNTGNVLFVLSGAFSGLDKLVKKTIPADDHEFWQSKIDDYHLMEYGLEREFVGRIPIRIKMNDLTVEDLYQILVRSGDSVLKDQKTFFGIWNTELDFSDEAIYALAEKAHSTNTGARALTKVVNDALESFKFIAPSAQVKKLVVDKEMVDDPHEKFVELFGYNAALLYERQFLDRYEKRICISSEAIGLIKEYSLITRRSIFDVCKDIFEPDADTLRADTVISAKYVEEKGYLES